jgi:hypothetical protein
MRLIDADELPPSLMPRFQRHLEIPVVVQFNLAGFTRMASLAEIYKALPPSPTSMKVSTMKRRGYPLPSRGT